MLCFLFSIYSGAQQKSNANRIELNCPKNHTEREIPKRNGLRERLSEIARSCASEMQAECAQYKHQLVATRKSCLTQWKTYEKTFNYRARPQLKRELLKRPTHIRIRVRSRIRTFAHTSAPGVGPEEQRGPLRQASRITLIERPSLSLNIPLPLSLPQVQLPACVRVETTPARRNRGRQIAGASLTSLRSSSTLCWD